MAATVSVFARDWAPISIQIESVNVLGLGFTSLPHNNGGESQYRLLETTISEHLDKLNATHDANSISVLALQEDVYLRKELLDTSLNPSEKATFCHLTTTLDTHKYFVRLPFLEKLLQEKHWSGESYFSLHDGMPEFMEYLCIKSEEQLRELWKVLNMGVADGAEFDRDRLIAALGLDEGNCHSSVMSRPDFERLPLKLCSPAHSIKLGNTFFVKFGAEVADQPIASDVSVFKTSEYPMYRNLPVRSAVRLTIGGINEMPVVMLINTHLVGGKYDDPQVWGERKSKNAPFDMLKQFFSGAPENVILVGDTNMRPEYQMERTVGMIPHLAKCFKKNKIMTQDSDGQWVSKLFEDVAFDADGKLTAEALENAKHSWYITSQRLEELSGSDYPESGLVLNNPSINGDAEDDTGSFGGHIDVCIWRSSLRGIRFVNYDIVCAGSLMWKEDPADRVYKHGGSDHLAQHIVFHISRGSQERKIVDVC